MKTETDCINDILELYEFHKKESDKYSMILGILRGTPDDNKIKPPVPQPIEKQTSSPTGVKVSKQRPKMIKAKIEYRECKDPRCKKKFVPVRKNQVYCSEQCSNKGSVYLNYLNKKRAKEISISKDDKEEKAEFVIEKEHDLIKKDHRGKEQKHLKSESFYNGQSAMP
jgi:hypothetical protein